MDLNTRAWETSLSAAIANTLASSTLMKDHLNSELVNLYDSQFESWKVMVNAGKIDNKTPPQPPAGYTLMTSEAGFSYAELGPAMVCAPRTDIPDDYSKPVVTTLPEPDHIRNVPKGDVMPVGYTVTASDGSVWQKQSSVTPFGVAYFYARID